MLCNLSAAKCELDSLMQEEEMIQQVATYYSIVDGSNELLVTGLLELSSTCHTNVEVLVSEIKVNSFIYIIIIHKIKESKITALEQKISKGFNVEDGPCMKSIQSCLNRLGVCRQHYYVDIFVGNHVHTILKVRTTQQAR